MVVGPEVVPVELKQIDEKIISDLIGKTVMGILSIPELSCLPRYNREDAVSAIASEVVALLKNLGIPGFQRDSAKCCIIRHMCLL